MARKKKIETENIEELQAKTENSNKIFVKGREVFFNNGLKIGSIAMYDDGLVVSKKAIRANDKIYITNKNGVIHIVLKNASII